MNPRIIRTGSQRSQSQSVRMNFSFLVSLLALPCCIKFSLANNMQYSSSESTPVVGTVKFKGSNLRIFEFDGAQVAEPRLDFSEICDSIQYNHVYLKYQLTLPVVIDLNALETPTDSSKRVGQLILTRLEVTADAALASTDSRLSVLVKLKNSGRAQLLFLCETFLRCQALKDEISTNPEFLQDALVFTPVGRVGGSFVKFVDIRSANLPRFSCPAGQWVVFQRRVDGSLSFAKNWDAYVKGFGNPESNYWMGLEKLFALTVTSSKNLYTDTARCQLRIEAQDFSGKNYWGEYKLFAVLGPEQNYRLRLGLEVAGSQFASFVTHHNEAQFSTYDKDNDVYAGSCSQQFGYGGWWFGGCHTMNINGPYLTDMSVDNSPTYNSIYTNLKYVPMKHTIMKFKCD